LKQHDMCNKKSHNDLKVVSEKKNPALSSGIFLLFPQFFPFKTAPIAGMECPPPWVCSC